MEQTNRIIETEAINKIVVQEVRPLPRGLITFSFISTWGAIALLIVGAIAFFILFSSNNEGHLFEYKKVKETTVQSNQWITIDSEVEGEIMKASNEEELAAGAVFLGVFVFLGIMAATLLTVIVYMIVFYKGWKSLQSLRLLAPGKALDMPSSAVATGLMFMPYYNIIWVFPGYMGFEKYGSALAELRELDYNGPKSEFAKKMGICLIASIVLFPLLPLFMIVLSIMSYMITQQINSMVERLGKSFIIERS